MDIYTFAAITCFVCAIAGAMFRKVEMREENQIAKKKPLLLYLGRKQIVGWRRKRIKDLRRRKELEKLGINVLEVRR